MLSSSVRRALLGARSPLRVVAVVQQRASSNRPEINRYEDPEPFERPPDIRIPLQDLFKNLDLEQFDKDVKRIENEDPEKIRDYILKVDFPDEPPKDPQEIDRFDMWRRVKWANDVLYGPDRDKEKFPHPTHWLDRSLPPVRHAVFPEHWFDALYQKVGVTGPYLLFFGGIAALLGHGVIFLHTYGGKAMGVAFLLWRFSKAKTFRRWREWALEDLQRLPHQSLTVPSQWFKELCNDTLKDARVAKGHLKARNKIWPVHIENFQLMLEDEYRTRLQNVYTQVKNRLDYQVAMESSMKTFEQEHMVHWITESVTKSITPELEKKNIAACIEQLKQLSKTATI